MLAILSALSTTTSTNSNAYRWANEVAQSLVNPEIRVDALARIHRAAKRWQGERVEGDYEGDTPWQLIQNMATALGIDVSDENYPVVRALRVAAKDDSPERVLRCCEHILVGQGAMGPIARRVLKLFNITTGGSKVVHCTLHDFHVEGKELDAAYDQFKRAHCDSCPDQSPRPAAWRLTKAEQQVLTDRHHEFIMNVVGTRYGTRPTDED